MNGATHPATEPGPERPQSRRRSRRARPRPGRGEELYPKLDLGEPRAISLASAASRRDPDVGRGLAHLAQNGVGDRGAARGLLERRGVELGDAPEVVLARGRARARRRPSPRARPGASTRSSSAAASVFDLVVARGTLSATSSGSSANQPTSLTTSGLPSESARIALPEVSPIVGERRLTSDVARRPSAPRAVPRRRTPRGRRPPRRARAAAGGARGRTRARSRRRAGAARRGATRARARTPRGAAASACSR